MNLPSPPFNDIDRQFAGLITQLSNDSENQSLFWAAALVSHQTLGLRNSCLDLAAVAGKRIIDLFDFTEPGQTTAADTVLPELAVWESNIRNVDTVGEPGEFKPLILDDQHRLFLYKYWLYEYQLAQIVKNRLNLPETLIDTTLQESIDKLFPISGTGPDLQREAAMTALKKPFCVISGGPGTGKTYTVTSILALLLTANPDLGIVLCAPTGKAAARLQESVRRAKDRLNILPDTLLNRIPEEASTIHRLLNVHGRDAKMPSLIVDAIVVDEASMVSISLMSRLLQAASDYTRIILLGDKNQLASVEAGAVLGDICQASEKMPSLKSSVVELTHSYRFEEAREVGRASVLINRGEAEPCLELLSSDEWQGTSRKDLTKPEDLYRRLTPLVEKQINPIFDSKTVTAAFEQLERFKILCAHRFGPFGVQTVNHLIEMLLVNQGRARGEAAYYQGKPIVIKQNDYTIQLYNGDTGIIWNDADGRLRAFFPGSDGDFRNLHPGRLPRHEAAYALTVHESQGSEFDEVLVILGDRISPLFSRELLYTAVTRARHRFEIWGDRSLVSFAINNKARRLSGLADKLTTP